MNNVYVGELTSEVHASGGAATGDSASEEAGSPWEQRAQLAATVDRVARLRARTATGLQ